MVKDTDNKATNTKSDAKGFYPADAQERNFENARKTAEINSEKDTNGRSVGSTAEDEIQERTTATEVINPVAQPDGTVVADTRTLDEKGNEVKAEDLSKKGE